MTDFILGMMASGFTGAIITRIYMEIAQWHKGRMHG